MVHAGLKASRPQDLTGLAAFNPIGHPSGSWLRTGRTPHPFIPQLHSPFSLSLTSLSFTTMFSLRQFALAIPLFLPLALADPIHIPLARRSSGNRDINYYISAAKHLQSKYNASGNSYSPHGKRASSESIQTINWV
jgi:hypothetical protein